MSVPDSRAPCSMLDLDKANALLDEPRHLPRDGEIPFEMRRRDRQGVGKVVEAAVGGFVAGQKRLHVDAVGVEREQIADRVVVLGPVQTMNGAGPGRSGMGRPCAIDFTFEPRCRAVVGCRVGPWPCGHSTTPR